jgi:hypothetical protein
MHITAISDLPTFAIRDADWMDTPGQSLSYYRLQGRVTVFNLNDRNRGLSNAESVIAA